MKAVILLLVLAIPPLAKTNGPKTTVASRRTVAPSIPQQYRHTTTKQCNPLIVDLNNL